ncbi:MAG: HEAT repeat domain-containing protein [Mangrovibacterium sp.]
MNKNIQFELKNRLQSGRADEVLQALEDLAMEGDVECLPVVIDLLHDSVDEQIVGQIGSLLGQLKQQEAVPHLMAAVGDDRLHDIREELLTACWENGLSYVDYIGLLVDIMISSDFMTAFEVHTLITNMWGKISREQRMSEESKIDAALLSINAEKGNLLEEVKDYLYALEEGVEPQEI